MIATYRVNWSFRCDGAGPWQKGEIVRLSVDFADWINRCSPGVLTEERAVEEPPKDRMVKAASKRKAKEEPITKATFKAVKNKGD